MLGAVWKNNYNLVSDSKVEKEEENFFEQGVEDNNEVTPQTMLNPKVAREMKKLQASFNKYAKKVVEQA